MPFFLWFVPSLAIAIFMIISFVVLFQKAKFPGWTAIIPFLNTINFYDIMRSADDFWCALFSGGIMLFLGFVIPTGFIHYALIILGSLICLYFELIICLHGARRFGKTSGYGIGIFLLPFIFIPMLAFGSSTYRSDI